MEKQDFKNTLCLEVCANCKAHSYCTHHDENKYKSYAADFTAELQRQIPGV